MRTLHLLFFFFLFWMIGLQELCASSDYPVTSSGIYFGGRASRIGWESEKQKSFGYLIGPSVGIDYRRPNHIYGGYRFYWMYGNTGGGSCHRKMNDMDMQVRVGYTFGSTLLFTPYTGLGVTAVTRKNSNTKAPCSRFSYTDVYVPVGVLLSYHPSSKFSIGIDYQYMPEVDSYYKTKGFHNIAFELHKKGQQSIEIPIQFCYPESRFEFLQQRIIPFFRTYYYGDATMRCGCSCGCDLGIHLPVQKAYEWGIRYEIAIW